MNHFIKLTSNVINKLHIIQIVQYPSKYYIYMKDNNLSGFSIFSFGFLSSNLNVIPICEKNNKQDYDIITDFIKKID